MSDVWHLDVGISSIHIMTGSSVASGGCASRSETPLQGSASGSSSVLTDDGAQVASSTPNHRLTPAPLVSQEFLEAHLSVGGKRPSTIDLCPSAAKKAAVVVESGRKRIG
jgi:hypothetical protein